MLQRRCAEMEGRLIAATGSGGGGGGGGGASNSGDLPPPMRPPMMDLGMFNLPSSSNYGDLGRYLLLSLSFYIVG